MIQTGGCTMTARSVVGVPYSRSPPPVEFVFQAVSPIAAGKVLPRAVQVDQAVAVGVRESGWVVFRDAQLMSFPAGSIHGRSRWGVCGKEGQGRDGLRRLLFSPGPNASPSGDARRVQVCPDPLRASWGPM